MSNLPLKGIRIVDSTYVVALPYAASILADLGAEVIKVEGPSHTEPIRGGGLAGSFFDNDPGSSPWDRATLFHSVNRGKKSLTLDLSQVEGRESLKELLLVSDVFMENFTPRVTRGWELDYPNVQRIKPDIIMVSNTGFGHGHGPYTSYPAQANSLEATHGLTHITGYLGGPPTKASQTYYADFLACWAALLGVALALRHRNRTGKGQWIDIGMYQLGAYTTSEYIMDWIANSRSAKRLGNRHPWRAPQGCYPCTGKDQWCVISVGDDDQWSALCRVMGRPEMEDAPRFSSSLSRMNRHDEIDGVITEWTRGMDKFDVMERLQGAGVPAGAVHDGKDMNLDPHRWSRGFLEVVDFPEERGLGKRVYMGRPWRLSKTPISIQNPVAKLGQNNQELLMGLLDYTQEQYNEMDHKGIIGDKPANPRPIQPISIENEVRLGRLSYYDPDYKQKIDPWIRKPPAQP
jgi:crotonobetainyl-CoA:carnitine CoA-transferase CaiB-like acyl-CoA transferase